MSRYQAHAGGGTTTAPPPHLTSALQHLPELFHEVDSNSPTLASPITPDAVDQILDSTSRFSPLAEWSQPRERDFHGFIAGQYRFIRQPDVPTLITPLPKGPSMDVSVRSILSGHSQAPPSHFQSHSQQGQSPSTASLTGFAGGVASYTNIGSGLGSSHKTSSRYTGSSSGRSGSTRSSSSDHNSLPSLIHSNKTFDDSANSVDTAIGNTQLCSLPHLDMENDVLVDHRGLQPQSPSGPTLECAFWFLDCIEVFHTVPEWKTHCRSHFRGNSPPRTATCPLCLAEFKGAYAWDQRMDHVFDMHHSQGYGLEMSHPDFPLFKWLWKKRIIDDATFKDLEGNFDNIRNEGLSTVTEGRTRETRREPPLNRRNA